ncbi:MAG: DUF721 domain-containing protein [Muribaculaceae bacterium]|jgi:hypothetical protein|nr:DUF721 domain-containing protein [Muribaculaceae bacterium]
MKHREAIAIGPLIDRLIDSCGARSTFEQQRVCYLWPEVMGPAINRRTARRWMDGGTMHVVITSAPLKSELGMMRSAIIARLNEAAGKDIVTSIVFH